jgi:Glycosyl transferases group 1
MSPKDDLCLFAPGVHVGGGLVLLDSIVKTWAQEPVHAFLDRRLEGAMVLPERWKVRWCGTSAIGRLKSERELAAATGEATITLCFSSLPPLFKLAGFAVCFVQNQYLVNRHTIQTLPLRTRLKLGLASRLLKLLRHHADRYVVQTTTMARALWQALGPEFEARTDVVPFLPGMPAEVVLSVAGSDRQGPDFIYPADGVAHKNHRRLIEAWIELSRRGLRPSLELTLPSRDAALIREVESAAATHGLFIENVGHLPHDDLLARFATSGALIFPSCAETVGIPLIEAARLNRPILASERDFVRDVCSPAQTFDPHSAVSIARAVMRHLGLPPDIIEPLDPSQFCAYLIAARDRERRSGSATLSDVG